MAANTFKHLTDALSDNRRASESRGPYSRRNSMMVKKVSLQRGNAADIHSTSLIRSLQYQAAAKSRDSMDY